VQPGTFPLDGFRDLLILLGAHHPDAQRLLHLLL